MRSAPEHDPQLRALLAAETPVVTLFGKSAAYHVTRVLRIDLPANLRLIEDSIAFVKRRGPAVVFDAEHFFDGLTQAPEYALACLRAAAAGGADAIALCDTNGGTLPWQVAEAVARARNAVQVPLGIHCHNDCGCAVASTLAAVRAGCTQVQGTLNGLGERCGNADLVAVIAGLELKLDQHVLPAGQLEHLTELARCVAEITNVAPQPQAPYVGRSAFAHKAGVHVSAVRRDPAAYEHVPPERIGNARRVLVSELAGRSNLHWKAGQFGLGAADESAAGAVVSQIKELESRGFAFEAAEASVELMLRRQQPGYRPPFELIDFLVVVEHRAGRGHIAEASVKLRVGTSVVHTASDGVGPVGALDQALRKALTSAYPQIEQFRLVDYKVRILDSHSATAALTRALIDTTDGHTTWTTVGASRNIIEASWQALSDSFEYGLLHAQAAEAATATAATAAAEEAA